MIFEREVYRKINFFKSMLKKYSLFNLATNKELQLSIETLYPASVKEIDNSRVDLLNEICHSKAFLIKSGKVFIELSKCNSCMKCRDFDGIVFSKINQLEKIIDERFLPLDR